MSSQGALGDWYRKILGEPLEADHVYGYWTFILGALLALVGLIVFLYSATFEAALELGGGPSWTLRAIAGSAAMFGGALVFLSVVLLLPLQRRATRIALLGTAICVIAVAAFWWAYPSNWYWEGANPDYSPLVMAVYSLGILIMIATAFLFPLSTDTEDPVEQLDLDVDAGPPESKATFELYEDRAGDHRWRLRHDNGNIIADSGEGYASKQKARQGLESVRENAPGAGEETIDREPDEAPETDEAAIAAVETDDDEADESPAEAAASEETGLLPDEDGQAEFVADSKAQFEVYEDRAGEHRWRLRHRNGNIIADGGEGYASKSGRDDAVERIKSVLPEADTLDYEPAAYEVYLDEGDEWRWRLRHKNGNILADSGEGYASKSNARRGIESVREHATDQDNFEVYEDRGGKYRWRLVADNDEIVADSGQGYSREGSARDAVGRISEYAPEADTLDYEPAAFELYEDRGGEWRWRLRHKNGNILADGGEGYASKQKAKQGMQSVIRNGPNAEVVEKD